MLLQNMWASTPHGPSDTPAAPHPAFGVAEEGGLPWDPCLCRPHQAVPVPGAVSSPSSTEGCETTGLHSAGNPGQTRTPC